MFYNGTVGDVETIVSNVLANSKCMVVKQLPKESAYATGQLAVVTGKAYHVFDLRIKLDRRVDKASLEIDRNAVSYLCDITPEIAQVVNRMQPEFKGIPSKVQQYSGQAVNVVVHK